MQEFLSSKCQEYKPKFKNFDVHTQRLDDFLAVYLHKMRNILFCGKIVRLYLYFHMDKAVLKVGLVLIKSF